MLNLLNKLNGSTYLQNLSYDFDVSMKHKISQLLKAQKFVVGCMGIRVEISETT